MNSIIAADLLELKARFETWRTNRKYAREPIPDALWKIALGHPRLPSAQSRPNANIGQVRIGLDSLEFKEEYRNRSGIEGTISQGARAFGLRRLRYMVTFPLSDPIMHISR